jgi:acetaldehyde dehydrogenase/alcohol dehydrogenase
MSFKANTEIDEKTWNEALPQLAMLAFEDQCTPANPRIPMVKDMITIMQRAYLGE